MIYLLHDAERYSETRIAYLLGLSEDEVRSGLHQARLRMRELLAKA
jgi:DNA-directed RNA polymerase specialized sigma24 family protein